MRTPIDTLRGAGVLRGGGVEIEVIYHIDVFQRGADKDFEGEAKPIDPVDLAELTGKELILVLQDGRKLPLSLSDAQGSFRTRGPLINV